MIVIIHAVAGPLGEDEVIAVLDGWSGRRVAVRIVASADELVAVFTGQLGARSESKHPSRFWPLDGVVDIPTVEQPGVYLHEGLVEDAALHVGDSVVEWRQAGAIVNVRLL